MRTALFINHAMGKNCGIYQQGLCIFSILSKSKRVNYFYREIGSLSDYYSNIDIIKPNHVIFNYYETVMPWLPHNLELKDPAEHLFILHDVPIRKSYDKYILIGEGGYLRGRVDDNNILDPSKCVTVPRPLYQYTNTYPKNDIPNIGSFGLMSSWHKGFDEIVKRVNHEFDRAVINLHITWSPICDPKRVMVQQAVDRCKSLNTNPRIKLNFSHDMLDNNKMLDYLARNDINVLYYKQVPQTGLSSAVDYMLSVNRPIAINNSPPFRHLYTDAVDMDKHTIKEILESGTRPLEKYYSEWSIDNFRNSMDSLFTDNILALKIDKFDESAVNKMPLNAKTDLRVGRS